ncbi:MarR family winged helix-turn-helix transcriptional regulator [Nonomuraea sp. NPDC050451]|uniref:MarR family winged helix-turn-helix transcriptional regulator n=1 Tax=Nonomuraea sp. NPDC050451 TaxID=3364364 RepID=UPI003797C0CE
MRPSRAGDHRLRLPGAARRFACPCGDTLGHPARPARLGLRINIADTGVTPGQFAQLPALYEEDGITQQELCERVRIDQSTMAHTLKRMQRDGLVVQTADPQDRRRSRYRLTERAREIQPELTRGARCGGSTRRSSTRSCGPHDREPGGRRSGAAASHMIASWPPSMTSSVPWMKAASSEARKA